MKQWYKDKDGNVVIITSRGDTLNKVLEQIYEDPKTIDVLEPHVSIAYRGADGWSDMPIVITLRAFEKEFKRMTQQEIAEYDSNLQDNCRCGGAGACPECNPGMFLKGIINY